MVKAANWYHLPFGVALDGDAEDDDAVSQSNVDQQLQQFEFLCRDQGIPLTIQRRDILKAVLERDDHPTVDQVYESVKRRIPGLSRTTVYRVLEALCSLGVIRRIHHSAATARFDANMSHHHHLVCRKCERVVDIVSKRLDDIRLPPSQRQGYRIEEYTVHFQGVCAHCQDSD